MDKIKIAEITHLMARIRALMDAEDMISARVNNEGYGETCLHIYKSLFLELFSEYKTARFDDTTDELSTEINGIKVFCLADKDVD